MKKLIPLTKPIVPFMFSNTIHFGYKYLFLIIVAWLYGCKKNEENSFSNTPEISYVNISSSSIKEYSDTLAIRISYKDGDGDLGENNPDVYNCFVTDSRNGVVYQYRIKQLSPVSGIKIKGELNVVLNSIPILNGQSSENVYYKIKVRDRAGNESNEVTTPAIMVTL